MCSGYKSSLSGSCKAEGLQAVQACPRLEGDVLGGGFFWAERGEVKKAGHRCDGSPDVDSCCLTGWTRNIGLQSIESGIYLACLVMSALYYGLASCGQ